MRLSTLLRRPCPAIPRRCNDLRELCPSRRRKRLAPATSVSVGRDQSPDTPSRGALVPNRGGSKTPPTPPGRLRMEGTGEGAGQSRIWVFEGGLGLLRRTKGVPHPHADRGMRARPLELMTQVEWGRVSGRKVLRGPPNDRGRRDARPTQEGRDRSRETARLGQGTAAGRRVGAAETGRRGGGPAAREHVLRNEPLFAFVCCLVFTRFIERQTRQKKARQTGFQGEVCVYLTESGCVYTLCSRRRRSCLTLAWRLLPLCLWRSLEISSLVSKA